MRHSAVTMTELVRQRSPAEWDVLFCSDMLNLAEFAGLASDRIGSIPAVAYFHENQLTYPTQFPNERDLHLAFTNFTTALAADNVWFNSQFHLDDFLLHLRDWLRRMPDHRPLVEAEQIRAKARVFPPSISASSSRMPRPAGRLRIV